MTNKEIAASWYNKLTQTGDYFLPNKIEEHLEQLLIDCDVVEKKVSKLVDEGYDKPEEKLVKTIKNIYGGFHGILHCADLFIKIIDVVNKETNMMDTPEAEASMKAAIGLFLHSKEMEHWITPLTREIDIAKKSKEYYDSVISALKRDSMNLRMNSEKVEVECDNHFIERLARVIYKCGLRTNYSEKHICFSYDSEAVFITVGGGKKYPYTVTTMLNGNCRHQRFQTDEEAIAEIKRAINTINRLKVKDTFDSESNNLK